mmetsp:Transcript_19249/g.41915  ORF Transcript_19249/g.41915 Transcript_19249/m.41915 type:complete len:222 (-) Transcript_19249:757-1422(-)
MEETDSTRRWWRSPSSDSITTCPYSIIDLVPSCMDSFATRSKLLLTASDCVTVSDEGSSMSRLSRSASSSESIKQTFRASHFLGIVARKPCQTRLRRLIPDGSSSVRNIADNERNFSPADPAPSALPPILPIDSIMCFKSGALPDVLLQRSRIFDSSMLNDMRVATRICGSTSHDSWSLSVTMQSRLDRRFGSSSWTLGRRTDGCSDSAASQSARLSFSLQ